MICSTVHIVFASFHCTDMIHSAPLAEGCMEEWRYAPEVSTRTLSGSEHFRFKVAIQSIHDFGAANTEGDALSIASYVPYAPRTISTPPKLSIIEP